jgi:hypothetical protein
VLRGNPCADVPSGPVNEPYKETSGTAQSQQAIDSPDLVHLLVQKPRSRSSDAQLLRFCNVSEGPASPLWWVARTPVSLMQRCPI